MRVCLIWRNRARAGLMALAFCAACLALASPAGAADSGTATWEEAKKDCAALNRNVLTVKALRDMGAGTGEGSFAALNLSEGVYWSSDESLKKGQYLVVHLPSGEARSFSGTDRHRFLCDRGPRRSDARTWEEAEAVCSSQGKKLPTVEYMLSIAGETGDGSYSAKGLKMGNYWTREPGEKGHIVVLTGNGKSSWFDDKDKFSIHCTD